MDNNLAFHYCLLKPKLAFNLSLFSRIICICSEEFFPLKRIEIFIFLNTKEDIIKKKIYVRFWKLIKKRNISHLRQKSDDNEILKKAINFHYQGNIVQASQLYRFLIDKGSKNSTIFSNYGLILINSGKLKDAEFFIRKAIELNPKDSTAHYNLGGILKSQRKIKDAEFLIKKAIELNPKDSTAHYNLAIVLKDLGKLEESELSYRKAIKIKPNYAEAH